MEMGRQAVSFAREISDEHKNASVEFSAEAASTTDMAYLEKAIRSAVVEGANVINVPDTVGQRDPVWMHSFYRQVIDWVTKENPETVISAHNHNDIGLAVANTLSLVGAAADYADSTDSKVNIQAESTICGLGERAGNADIFSFMGGVFKFSEGLSAPISWKFNQSRSVEVARNVMAFGERTVHRQAPIVGEDTNVHRSGIHSDGVIKGGFQLYTPHDPRFWGHSNDAIHQEGRYQGKSGRAAAMR